MASNAVEGEYSTNNPEERKRIRRRRIEKRHAAETNADETKDSLSQGAQKSGQQQVSESLFHLDRRKFAGIQDVTSIRVETDEHEAKRRIDDERTRHDRLAKLQHEALASAKANAAIEMKWAELLEREIPQELHHEIQLQMSSCSSIIHSKDSLISEFQRQLRAKDEEYVRALRKQAADVEELLVRIRKEFRELHSEYDKELDAIEDAYGEERDKMIGDHSAEMDELFDQRRTRENYYKEAKQKREEMYQREMEDLITRGADQYNKLKIELEMNIQTLKEQLEEIRATYQLNTEKLDYNYRVLTELDVEKNAELARYKRRLARLKEQLNNLVTKFNDMEALDSKTNSELTEDYRRLTQKYKDLQSKFRHFEMADTSKFEEVWRMHDDEAKDLVDQLLKADLIISEQQLGWKWKAPDMRLLQGALGGSGSVATDLESATAEGDTNLSQTGAGKPNSTARESAQLIVGSQSTTVTVSGTRIRAVLRMLASEAAFLLNTQVQQALADMPEEEATLARAETLLRSLGVKSEGRMRALVSHFFQDATPAEEGLPGEKALLLNAEEDDVDLKHIIRPEDVISAVRAFVDEAAESAAGGAGPVVGVEDGTSGGKKRANKQQLYWEQLAQVVNDDSVAVWRQLEKDLVLHKDILSKRASKIAEVDALGRKNAELKRLLNLYLGARSNDFLQVPPAQTMRIRPINRDLSSSAALPSATASSASLRLFRGTKQKGLTSSSMSR